MNEDNKKNSKNTVAKTDSEEKNKSSNWSSRKGGRNRSKNLRDLEPKEFTELVISIDRVARVVKGGRRFRFKALVAVGDQKNRLGLGIAKGGDVQTAVAKATQVAKKHLINIPIENDTIPHDVLAKVSGAQILLKPAAPGTGIKAGGAVRKLIGITGIKNLLSKSIGSSNHVNVSYATMKALQSLVPRSEWHNLKTVEGANK